MGRRSPMIWPVALMMAGAAVAQQPALRGPGAPNDPSALASSSRLPVGVCFSLQNIDSPSQRDLALSVDRCTAHIARLSESRPSRPQTLACAYFARGIAHAGLQEHALAISDYGEAIKLMPRYPQAFKYRGIAHQELRDYPRALADYNEAIRQNDTLDSAFNNRAEIHYRQGDLAHAVADYSEAIRLAPGNAIYYRSRANAYRAQNDESRANADLAEWKRLIALGDIIVRSPYPRLC